jgi:Glycosyl transferase family 2
MAKKRTAVEDKLVKRKSKSSRKSFSLIATSVCVIFVAVLYYYVTEHWQQKRNYGRLQQTGIELERAIVADEKKFFPGLGEAGAPSNLSQKGAYLRGRHDLETVFLNVELSKHISYNRTLSDGRHADCKRQRYDLDKLPTTSVVIIFYNEPFSVLMRTVHSVLNTADGKILHEIILVDDCSDAEELQDKLNYYMETRLPPKVKLIRLRER